MWPRSWLSATVVDGTIYALGGFNREGGVGGILASVQAYDPQTDSWMPKPPMSPERMCMAVGVVDGVIYVAGGSIAGDLDRLLDAYDPKTDTWTRKAPMPTPRCGAVGGVIDGVFYVVGPAEGTSRTMEAYDPKTDTWRTKAPMPTPSGGAAGGVIDGILYVVGGGATGVEVQAYDPKTDAWTTKAPMPTPRWYLGAGVVNGFLYAVGGHMVISEYDVVVLATVEAYDPKTNTWTTVPPMPTPRHELAVAVVGDTLYALGGRAARGSPTTYLGVNEAFSPFLHVAIDIKPGDRKNTINLKSQGVVAVAILGSATFDPLTVDPTTVTLAGAPVATRRSGVPMTAQGDFNRDGYLDLLLHFRTQDLQLTPTSTEAVLYGTTTTGQRLRGADSVRIVRLAPTAGGKGSAKAYGRGI